MLGRTPAEKARKNRPRPNRRGRNNPRGGDDKPKSPRDLPPVPGAEKKADEDVVAEDVVAEAEAVTEAGAEAEAGAVTEAGAEPETEAETSE